LLLLLLHAAAIGCFLMAFLANMPLAVAPGMGINAYFTYVALVLLFVHLVRSPQAC
jgi:AGZA family xanthine/uracil permease-like MFS transporter